MNDEQHDIVDELITKYLAGEATPAEEKQVLAWVARNTDNERHYLDMKKVFDASGPYYEQRRAGNIQEPAIEIDQEWNHFVQTIGQSGAKSIPLPPHTSRSWLRIAAALLVLVASGLVINYFVVKRETHYQTDAQSLALSLPDGSSVILNSHSELSYSAAFGETDRGVTLKGEALFEVTPNRQKPFVIAVNEARVEVVGTRFNVQGYDQRETLEVTVQSGVVRFSVPGEQEVRLEAGQRGSYRKAGRRLESGSNDDVNFLSWNTRKVVFAATDLRSVVETLNRMYQADIVIATDVPVSCQVTVTFDHQTLDAVLHVLETTLNLTYRKAGERIEITHVGC